MWLSLFFGRYTDMRTEYNYQLYTYLKRRLDKKIKKYKNKEKFTLEDNNRDFKDMPVS